MRQTFDQEVTTAGVFFFLFYIPLGWQQGRRINHNRRRDEIQIRLILGLIRIDFHLAFIIRRFQLILKILKNYVFALIRNFEKKSVKQYKVLRNLRIQNSKSYKRGKASKKTSRAQFFGFSVHSVLFSLSYSNENGTV